MSKYIIYCRKSTDEADKQQNSLDNQQRICLDYAQKNNIQLSHENIPWILENGIILESHSAWKTHMLKYKKWWFIEYKIERPKFMQMIDLVTSWVFEWVLVKSWDRISRNKQDDLILEDLIKTNQINLVFAEWWNEKGMTWKMIRQSKQVFSQQYSDFVSENVAKSQRLKKDRWETPFPSPVWYLDKWSNNKIIDPEKWPIIKRLFEKYATKKYGIKDLHLEALQIGLKGKGKRRHRTEEEKIKWIFPPKIERPIWRSSLHEILSNPFFIWKIREWVYKFDMKKWKSVRVDWIVSQWLHKALISEDLFEKVQSVLNWKNPKKHKVKTKEEDTKYFTYRKLIKCTCGRSYSPYKQKGLNYYKSSCTSKCDNKETNLSEEEIDKIVQKNIFDKMNFTKEQLKEIDEWIRLNLNDIKSERDKKVEEINLKEKKLIADLDYLNDNKISLLRDKVYDNVELKKEENKIKENLHSLKNERDIVIVEWVDKVVEDIVTFLELSKMASQLYKLATPLEKRKLFEYVILELKISNKKPHHIQVKEPFSDAISFGNLNWLPGVDLPRGGGINEISSPPRIQLTPKKNKSPTVKVRLLFFLKINWLPVVDEVRTEIMKNSFTKNKI